jgi:hypothetical protein
MSRFQGVHLNLSLSGNGVSAGGRGFHAGMTARGQTYVSAGNSGDGLSFWPLAIAAGLCRTVGRCDDAVVKENIDWVEPTPWKPS